MRGHMVTQPGNMSNGREGGVRLGREGGREKGEGESMKIAYVGAGSITFGPRLIADVLLSQPLQGCTLALVDVNEERAALMEKLGRRMAQQANAGVEIEAMSQQQALDGADFVLTTIGVGGFGAEALDIEVPRKYGIAQSVGDTVGPGGLSRALRTIPATLDICRDMERLCPDAWLLNFTNPLSAVCRAVALASKVKCVGLCHGIEGTRDYLAGLIGVERQRLTLKAAGINHLTWIRDLLIDGEDSYPRLGEALAEKPDAAPVSRELMETYGLWPSPGDSHVAEFFSFFFGPEAEYGEKYGLPQWPHRLNVEERQKVFESLRAQAEGEAEIGPVKPSGEWGLAIIETMKSGQKGMFHVNVTNGRAICNLPEYAVVELDGDVEGRQIRPRDFGELPPAIASHLRRIIDVQEMTARAAIDGDRLTALQALAADPLCAGVTLPQAREMLDELLSAHSGLLPQFV